MREDGARGLAPWRPVPALQHGQDGCPHRQARGVGRSGASLSVHTCSVIWPFNRLDSCTAVGGWTLDTFIGHLLGD